MDNIINKYIMFAVGIFVTIMIFTVVVISLDKVGTIYGQTIKTDISIKNRLDDVEYKYRPNPDGSYQTVKAIGVINALKTYEEEENINIQVVDEKSNTLIDTKVTVADREVYFDVKSIGYTKNRAEFIEDIITCHLPASYNSEFPHDRPLIQYYSRFSVSVTNEGNNEYLISFLQN